MRDRIAEQFALSADDFGGMLMRIGRDVAGAAVIVPAGEPPVDESSAAEPLSGEDLMKLVEELPERPLGIDASGGIRLSLAGQQDKLVLVRTTAGWARPLFGYPSTTILKPEPGKFPGLVTNEFFALNLAATVGLESARARIERFGPHVLLSIDRFDRVHRDASPPERVHQEDILTAAGFDPLYKYEYDDEYGQRGPSLRDMAELLVMHIGSAQLGRLLEIVVFNLVLGNADAHARNLSLLLARDGSVALAPLYDVISTLAYPNVSKDLPQRIANKRVFDDVTFEDLVEEAIGWGLAKEFVMGRARRILDSIKAGVDSVVRNTRDAGGDTEVLDQLRGIVLQRGDALS